MIHNLEKQIGQLVKLVSKRTLGTLPRNMKVNLREHVYAILVRYNGEDPNMEAMVFVQETSPKKEEGESNRVCCFNIQGIGDG